ncbi:MAG: tetratricopeptide repeat protein [Deltaproteobacteria bacterium]|nr:tetratricopeptide repeat protein [Deltaproteobacteria bacterium]
MRALRGAAWRVEAVKRRGIPLFVLCLVIVAAYFPTFGGEFILDDRPFVKENPMLRGVPSPVDFFMQEDGIIGGPSGIVHSGYYRPLTNMTYSLDFKIWGMRDSGFRATNLALHVLTCLMLYFCVSRVVGGRWGPFLAALLFGLHPANTESVAWVTSRNNILVTLFSMASFHFYARPEEDLKSWPGVLSMMCFALALLSKEFAVVLLPIMVIYDRVVRKEERPLRKALWGYLALFFILAAYILLRKCALQGLVPVHRSIGSPWQSLVFAPFLVLENLRIILLPLGLHNFMVTYPAEPFGWEFFAGVLGTLFLLYLLWRWRANRIVLFSLLSFALALVPVLNILPTRAYSLVSMRWLYFPMAFLSFAAAWGLDRLAKWGRRPLACALTGVAALYLGAYTFTLNEHLWKDEEGFFEREVTLFGNDFYSGDLARIHHKRGNLGEAERYYRIAEKNRFPKGADLFLNHGGLLVELGKFESGLAYLKRAESLNPGGESRGLLHNNRGAAYYRTQDYRKAIQFFRKATLWAPREPSYVMNLAEAYMQVREYEKAASVLRRSLHLHPDPVIVRKRLGTVYLRMGDYARVRRTLEEVSEEMRAKDIGIRTMLRYAEEREKTAIPLPE